MAFKFLQYPVGIGLMVLVSVAGANGQDDSQEQILDEIVAKVNQDVITLTDLNKELRLLRISLRDDVEDPAALEDAFQNSKKGLLRNLIRNKVMEQQAEELGLTANVDAEVEAALDRMREQLGIPNLEVLDQALQERGTSLQEYRQNMKNRMIVDWLVQQAVYSKITLLTPEIEQFYSENQERFSEPAEVELAEILFLTEGKDPAAVREKAREALSKVRSGVPFEEVAREYSDGPTANQGGNIGSFREGSLAEEVDAVVFSMEKGEISDIVETGYGLQILKLIEKKERRAKPLEEVREQIQRYLYQKKAEPELKIFVEELLQKSYIYVAAKYRAEYDVAGL